MDIDKLKALDVINQFVSLSNDRADDAVSLIVQSINEVSFANGDEIVRIGDDADDGMYIIIEGTADVLGADGHKINELVRGDMIGELALITDSPRAATVKATSPMLLANITRQVFEENALKNKKIYGAFMSMLYKRCTSLVAQRERIKSELDIAARIQRSQLTRDFDKFKESNIDIYADMLPAKEVGGDFYDAFYIDKRRICFLVADVSGKGVPAAMFMTLARTNIRNFSSMGLSLEQIVSMTNNQLCQNNDANMFVTAFICVFDLEDNKLEYINAGHNLPYIKKGGSWSQLIADANLVLGIMPDMHFVRQELVLNEPFSIFVYTDGVTEALDKSNRFLGENRLELFLKMNGPDAKSLVESVFVQLADFTRGAEQSDDITMLVFSNIAED